MESRLRGILTLSKPPPELRPAIDPLLAVLKTSLVSKRLYEDVFSTPEDAEAFAIAKGLPPDQTQLLLLMQERKSVYVPNKWLDFILTAVFLAQCGLVMMSMHAAGLLPLFLVLLVLADSVVARMKDAGSTVGRAVSAWLHARGFVAVDPLSGRIQLKKWREQSWQLGVHIVCTVVELHILSVEPWYESPATCWIPPPLEQHGHHSMELQLLYLGALAIWIYTCLMHRFFDERKRDYFVMYLHHVATIGLVGLSWHSDLLRVGMLVMFVHDASDIFIDLLKMTNLLKLEGARGWFLSEAAYVASLVAWAYFRLYEYPFRVMHSSFILAYRVTATKPRGWDGGGPFGLIPPELPLLLYNNILLGLLLCMHVYWFYLLMRVGYRIVTESAAQASRMEYEGDSDVEDETGHGGAAKAALSADGKDAGKAASGVPASPGGAADYAVGVVAPEGGLSPRRGFAAGAAK